MYLFLKIMKIFIEVFLMIFQSLMGPGKSRWWLKEVVRP
jgi:hypothetical protein